MRRLALGLGYMALIVSAAGGSSLGAAPRTTVGVHVARDDRFSAGAQFAWSTGGVLEILSTLGLGGGLTIEYVSTLPSPVVDLVTYRGYSGARLAVFAAWWVDLGPLRAGARVGALGEYMSYTSTQIYFVTPGVFVEPALSLPIGAGGTEGPARRGSLGVSLNVAILRRPDLVLSAHAALAVEVGVYLGRSGLRD
jgi:hypothetical protein